MATIYRLKPAFQRRLRPVCRGLVNAGVSANQVTVAALVLSAAAGGCVAVWPEARWPLLALPVVLFVRMALNAIDGMIAREHDMPTPLGGLLNELGDVISDACLYLPFALVPGLPAEAIVGVVVLAGISECAGLSAVAIGASRRYDGPMGKSDRAFTFGVLALVLGLGVTPGPWADVVLGVILLASVATIVNRGRRALAEVRGA